MIDSGTPNIECGVSRSICGAITIYAGPPFIDYKEPLIDFAFTKSINGLTNIDLVLPFID